MLIKSVRSFLSWKSLAGGAQLSLALALLALLFSGLAVEPARASGNLTITPITWDVIGLDSNNVNVGPEHFPVGARVCNTSGSLSDITVTFDFDGLADNYTGDDFINLRAGTESQITFDDVPSGTGDSGSHCRDAYFEASVTRDSNAYTNTRAYTITASDGTNTVSTPSPRQLYVERLISQNRNATLDIKYGTASDALTSVAPGGSMNLVVGNTYFIQLDAKTATQGYEQLETFITLSNTVFQILSVETTYSANTAPLTRVPTPDNPHDQLWADACLWQANPLSPNYRSCIESSLKSGGTISVLYEVTIIGGGSTTETLNSLIYDFSGASYHYNSDFSSSARFANILDPTQGSTITKRFIPSTIADGGIATLRFTISNPHPVTVSGYNFIDTLPGNIVVADDPNVVNNCGGTVTAEPEETTISLADGVFGPNSTCSILVDVTAPYDSNATYPLVNSVVLNVGEDNPQGDPATAPLTVTQFPPPPQQCTLVSANTTLAAWNDFDSATSPTPTTTYPGVSSGASSGLVGTYAATQGEWRFSTNTNRTEQDAINAGAYIEFRLNTTGIDSVNFALTSYAQNSNAPQTIRLYYGPVPNSLVATGLSGFTVPQQNNKPTGNNYVVSGLTSNLNPSGETIFRVYIYNGSGNSPIRFDDVLIQGQGTVCTNIPLGSEPNPPTLSKVFVPSPVYVGQPSTLTFTLSNPNVSAALSEVTFRDELPAGMTVVSGTFVNSCGGGTWGLEDSNPSILLFTGGALAANSSCTLTVDVISTTIGQNLNVSDPIDARETYPGNSAIAELDVLPPPSAPLIFKQFDPNPLLFPDTTITLTFRITNTDPVLAIEEVAFVDTLPEGMTPANNPLGQTDNGQCGAAYSFTWNAGTRALSFSSGEIAAGEDCEIYLDVDVDVEASDFVPAEPEDDPVVLDFANQTGLVSHVFNDIQYFGNSATDTLLVRELRPGLSLSKQVGLDDDIDGQWLSSLLAPANTRIYYLFTVENTGDVDLTDVSIVDETLAAALGLDPITTPLACTWYQFNPSYNFALPPDPDTNSYYVPVSSPLTLPAASADSDPIAYCIIGLDPELQATTGAVTNNATASGVHNATTYISDLDSATYINGNFGNLPTDRYGEPANLYEEGGAMHLNGTAFLGSSVNPTAADGTNTPASSWALRPTDNGVTWTPNVAWSVAGGGSVDVNITCPTGTCYLSAWFDWNKDGDFNDTGEFVNFGSFIGTGIRTLTFSIPSGTDLTDANIYARFRLYSAEPVNPSPYGLAVGSGDTALAGEIEDVRFDIEADGTTPTPVTLSYFHAERRGANVTFEWSTSTETGNIGFHLYVVDASGQLRQINPELIESAVVDSVERQDYTFRAKVDGDTFYIEDVSIWGETDLHGPFEVGQAYGERLESDPIDHAAIAREVNQKAAARQAELRKEMKLLAVALRESTPALPQGSQLTNTVNILVDQTGIQRVTYEALRDAGLDLNGVPAVKVAVMNRGQVVPIHVEARGKFGPGSYLEFYGEALDTLYTDTNVYTVQVINNSLGNDGRVSQANQPVNNRAQSVPSYLDTLVVNEQRTFVNYAPGNDNWYHTSMMVYTTPKSWNFPFTITGLADGTAATSLELVVWGVTDWPESPDHHLRVSVNGVQLANEYFDGLVEKTFILSLPSGLLREGVNTLTLTLPGDTGVSWDMVNLDKFSVAYPRIFRAEEGRLTFTAAGDVFKVTNLPANDVSIYRLTAGGVARLSTVNITREAGAFSATFAGSKESATYLVTTGAAMNRPVLEPTRLTVDLNQPAEFLIISHPHFIEGLAPLVAARRAEGLTVNVVNVDDLYARYAYGIFDPQAIQTHIRHAAAELGAKYVLLVGGDTYDYYNHTGRNSISFIPSMYIATGPISRFVPADPLYADLSGDGLPDLPIGRFPVRSQAELALMVQKTLAYGQKDYAGTALFVTDKRDPTISFKNISRGMEVRLPAGWSVESVHLDDLTVVTARQKVLAAMNRGTALVTFTGHSGPTAWTFNSLFTTSHAASLTNAGRPFVAVQWGCWNTYYIDPVNSHLVHSLLFSGDKGAAAVLGAVGRTESRSEQLLGDLLTPRITQPGVRMGDALQESKTQLAQTHPDLLDVLLGWTLMGDPTLVIQP
jgi:uncharacterized repeat protein (TIGR01451 family)